MTDGSTEAMENTVAAAAELKLRNHDLSEKLEQLSSQQRMLEEVCASLAAEEKELERKLRLIREKAEALESHNQTVEQRLDGTERTRQGLEQEVAILERRCAENSRRLGELRADLKAEQDSIVTARDGFLEVTQDLETGRAALVRIDRKLNTGLKR